MILGFLPCKAGKQFKSKITKLATFKVTKNQNMVQITFVPMMNLRNQMYFGFIFSPLIAFGGGKPYFIVKPFFILKQNVFPFLVQSGRIFKK